MSKIKNAIMGYDNVVFQQMQKQLFEEMVQSGSPNTEFKPLNPYALGGNGLKVGNNFSSLSSIGTGRSAVSKQETLILNAQARPSITTKAKKPKATPSTTVQNYQTQGVTPNFGILHDFHVQQALGKAEKGYLETPDVHVGDVITW